ncbi:klaroid [Carabus blaptoides fortunei]
MRDPDVMRLYLSCSTLKNQCGPKSYKIFKNTARYVNFLKFKPWNYDQTAPDLVHRFEEVMMQHTYSTRTRSYKSNNSTMSDEVFSSPVAQQKSSRLTRRNRLKTSDYSSEDGETEISSSKPDESSRSRVDTYTVRTNGEVKSALQVYKEAGEYWNKFPKTDYTYSVHSKDRVELAPGVIAMPNMSRRSLRSSTEHNNHTSHSQQRYNETHRAAGSYSESHTAAAAAAETTLHHDFRPKALFRDSYMEDTTVHSVVERVSIVRRLYRSVTTVLWSVLIRVLTALAVLYWTGSTAVLWLGQWYYRVVSRVLLFDTWILQGTNGRKRYGTLAAILALPLLVFGGWWLWSTVAHWAIPSPVPSSHIPPVAVSQARSPGAVDSQLQLQMDNIVRQLDVHEQQLAQVKDQMATVHSTVAHIHSDTARNNVRISAELKRCCSKQYLHLETYVKKILTDLLRQRDNVSPEDISTWLHSVFVAKQDLETRLNNVTQHLSVKFERLVEESAVKIMHQVSDRINAQIREKLALRNSLAVDSGLTDSQVERIVKETLAVYDADKTGLVDYALEPSGGQILSTRCTESYNSRTAVLSVLGVPLWYPSNTPRVVITPGVTPGECWAFQNFPGFLVIQLTAYIHVQGFTLEHIPRSLAPGGRRDSAPRAFTVWALRGENDREPQLLGSYEYELAATSLQYFAVQHDGADHQVYNMVELRVDSNHGNSEYTCLYRFRVHGTMEDAR